MSEQNLSEKSTRQTLGQVKVEICQRLGDGWKDLANYFQIPPHEEARFDPGDECRDIWAWLESRRRLEELPEALRYIKRKDLADLWLQGRQESTDRYYRNCIERWSHSKYALDKRFVQLTLLLDQGPDTQGPRWQAGRQFRELGEVLDETPEQAIVLLGPPGSGKSTLLRHFELDNAQAVLANAANQEPIRAPLTFFIQLNEYRRHRSDEPLPLPRDWLAERWQSANPDLPSLETLLQARRLTLLLDALNEMPSGDDPIRRWKDFLLELAGDFPGNRVIFSCRSLDYSASLSSKERPVPQVRIELLSDDQVQHFLQLYCPEHADTLWLNLKNTSQLALLRLPYFLKLLVEQTVGGEVPEGRAALFTGFVRQALKREVRGDHPLFQPDVLLQARDYERLTQAKRWKTPYELPSRGILFPSLGKLAFEMQLRRPEREASQVRVDYDAALAILNSEWDRNILKAGEALGVLEEDLDRDEVLFVHQLLQEYFAGRRLADAPNPQLAQVAWQVETVTPSLQETLAGLADADPLPPLPGTGWEETTVLAAAMNAQPDAFVAGLMEVNLPLAGRCAAQPDVRISTDLKERIRWALVECTQDPKADLRARIVAGLELGGLGDPRFERRQGPYGEYLLPPLVAIPGGTYPIGSDEGHYEDESPVHTVELASFQIGKFPVTNAEWTLFMQAGGYEDERWWEMAAAQAWRRGEGTAEGPKQDWREDRKWIQDNLDRLHNYSFTSVDIERYREFAQMSDEAFERMLEDWYPPGRQVQPDFWSNDAYNKPAQPVVGIGWYEARAYCAWLSAQTGMLFRLPTEVEWEAAARGPRGRRYAYGDNYDAARCNTFDTHIRRTTPIGVFPGGETPEGVVDLTGNTWDWTGSLYRPYLYNAADGRENPIGDGRRVVRGGAWRSPALLARAAYRYRNHPGGRFSNLGVRVLAGPPPI
ncbi:MAG: SUMF1/EgtB/PvdO family nonheme iron enzyme [Candidatus Competibacteraceae bacterium]